MRPVLAALALLLATSQALWAQAFETSARSAWVYDVATGTVLMEKNSDLPLPPASMSKLMTIYMVFDALERGQLTEDMTLPVSEHAMSYEGSSMFLNTLDRPNVIDLVRGVIILSGNDAATVLAEALSPDGTEAGFASLMNRKAAELGMTDSHFVNANGWPAEGHVMSARDLGTLARHLVEDFPEYYKIFAETSFEYDGRVPSNSQNRNPILGLGIGADGLKTGHTEEAGYGLVGSAVQDGRRVILVITGLPSMDARRTESERIINWAFRQFAVRDVGEAGQKLGEAQVWMGSAPRVGLVLPEDLQVLIPVNGARVEAHIAYQGPVAAPIAEGDHVADLVLTREGMPDMRLPLVAEAAVARGGFVPRVTTAMQVIMGKVGLGIGPGRDAAAEEPADEGADEDADADTAETGTDEPAAEAPADPVPQDGEGEGLAAGD